jgi:hypothetical protein
MKTKLAALALTVAFSAPALAEECTAELAQAKSMEVNAGLQKLAAKDPQRMQEVATEMMEKSAMFENAEDLSEVCEYYDDLLEEMNS